MELDSASEMLLVIGSKEGLTHLPWAVTDPGDVVLVPDPAYNAYSTSSALAGARPQPFALERELGWIPDLSAIPSEVAQSARLMYVNYPNNPTGATATLEFYRDLVRFAQAHDIIVCSDCAYSEVTYDGYSAPSILQVPEARDVAIEFHSHSKAFNMTGWRIGFAAGNKDVIFALNKLKSNLDSRQFPAIAEAAAYALRKGDNSATMSLYRKRRDILVDGLNSLGWQLEKPKGTFYVWANCPGGRGSIEFCKELLEKAGVLAIPGIGYGANGEGFIRMSLTVSGDRDGARVHEAIDRIRDNISLD